MDAGFRPPSQPADRAVRARAAGAELHRRAGGAAGAGARPALAARSDGQPPGRARARTCRQEPDADGVCDDPSGQPHAQPLRRRADPGLRRPPCSRPRRVRAEGRAGRGARGGEDRRRPPPRARPSRVHREHGGGDRPARCRDQHLRRARFRAEARRDRDRDHEPGGARQQGPRRRHRHGARQGLAQRHAVGRA